MACERVGGEGEGRGNRSERGKEVNCKGKEGERSDLGGKEVWGRSRKKAD